MFSKIADKFCFMVTSTLKNDVITQTNIPKVSCAQKIKFDLAFNPPKVRFSQKQQKK